MTHITARGAKSDCQAVEDGLLRSGFEGMAWMMTMLQLHMTWYAEVIVVADSARNEVGFLENYRYHLASYHDPQRTVIPTTNTTIASPAEVESLTGLVPLELRGESSWNLFLCLNLGKDLLGSNSLGRASN